MDAEFDALAAGWRKTGVITFADHANVMITYLYDNGASFRGKPHGSVLYLGWGAKERRDWPMIERCVEAGKFIVKNMDGEVS